MPKSPTNLSLEPAVFERGKRYSAAHGTNVSQLVGDFLARLPDDDETDVAFSPTVTRLLGIVTRGATERERDSARAARERYRAHLLDKYGAGPDVLD